MPRPLRATIDIAALRHNLRRARARAGARRIWAVVKANAYGHGVERAVRGFTEADGLALLDLVEARRARAAGWTKPILLLEGVFDDGDLREARALDLALIAHSNEQIEALARMADGAPLRVHLKLNTGMNRLGFTPAAFDLAYRRLAALPTVKIDSLCMHFANADRDEQVSGPVSMGEQLATFGVACAGKSEPRSICNSAALFLHEAQGDDWVRPGIALYGAMPDERHSAEDLGLIPAMRLESQLIAVQEVAAGAAVGYGARFVAERALRIGVVACGYADGYPRHAPDGTPVLVDGVRVPLAGRVSMDMLTVDLSTVPQARVGSAVELWGAQVAIDEVALPAGTVGYELMCALAPRVEVVEINN
ncbi:MAG: alanine racemase [Burkholderiaceae bacterium]